MKVDLKPFQDRLRSLARLGRKEVIREELADQFPEDLADALSRMEIEEGLTILRGLPEETAAYVLIELPTETARQFVQEMPDSALAHYLDILPMDDAVALREEIGDDRFESLLEIIPQEDARELRRLLTYAEDSVGRIMTESFFEVRPEQTMADVLQDVRSSPAEKYEMVNDVYVLGEGRHLMGVFSLRKAIRAAPQSTCAEVMNTNVVTCQATDTDEEAARKMARYGFYALPVMDAAGRMVGLFTGDDAQTILREAETEDVLKLGAVSGDAEAYLSLNVWQLVKRRFPWLLALFVAETFTGAVMRHYGQTVDSLQISPLTFFIPLLIGAGGNSGSQVTTTITRALALGEIRPGDWLKVMRRELMTAILIGLMLGVCGFFRAYLPVPIIGWNSGWELSLTVGVALPLIIIWSATVGSLLPIGAKRLGLDPAVMSAPFITTFVDATGLIIYFEIARRIMAL